MDNEEDDTPRDPPKPTMANAVLSNLPHLMEKDPGLLLTPEKSVSFPKKPFPQDENQPPRLPPGILDPCDSPEKDVLLSKGLDKADLIPTRLNALTNDPTLDVTPEKPQSTLKLAKMLQGKTSDETRAAKFEDKNAKNRHVRFDVPDSSTESVDEGGNEQSFSESSSLSDTTGSFMGKDPSNEESNQQPFKTRAALYTQRNPLADITRDSSLQESSDNTTASSETFYSNDSESSSLFNQIARYVENNTSEVLDMGGKVIRGDPKVTQTLPKVKLKTTKKDPIIPSRPKAIKNKIINVVPSEKQGVPRATIDQLTRPKIGVSAPGPQEGRKFLRKKSGLHRHEHSVRYRPDPVEETNVLSEPTYNSTMSLGQELQELKITEFDAEGLVRRKLAESETLRNYVAEKTAEATNIDPEEQLYQNLVSIDVPSDEIMQGSSAVWKRIKPKPFKAKKTKCGEPNIMDTFTPDLFFEQLIFDMESIKVPPPVLSQAPLDSIMSLDEHSQIWNNV